MLGVEYVAAAPGQGQPLRTSTGISKVPSMMDTTHFTDREVGNSNLHCDSGDIHTNCFVQIMSSVVPRTIWPVALSAASFSKIVRRTSQPVRTTYTILTNRAIASLLISTSGALGYVQSLINFGCKICGSTPVGSGEFTCNYVTNPGSCKGVCS